MIANSQFPGPTRRSRRIYLVREQRNDHSGLLAEAGFDPAPVWAAVHQPTLLTWGLLDHEVPPARSARLISDALDDGGNTRHQAVFFPAANHILQTSTDGSVQGLGSQPFAPRYAPIMTSWVNSNATQAVPAPAGPPAHEIPVPANGVLFRHAWYETAPAQFSVMIFLAALFATYPTTAALRRIRRHRPAPPGRSARRWARCLAGAGLTTVAGLLGVVLLIANAGPFVPIPAILGRPLPWLGLQLAAALTLLAGAALIRARWRTRHHPAGDQTRHAALLAGLLVFLPWALSWHLLAAS